MKVLKFGGSSVASPQNIQKLLKIVSQKSQKGKVAVVVSAFGGVTDALIGLSELAQSGDFTYQEAFTTLKTRHQKAVEELLSDGTQKEECFLLVESLFEELKDILHGVFLVRELSPKTLDFILGFGERLSAYIIAQAFVQYGEKANFVDSRKLIVTDEEFGNAKVDFSISNPNILRHFANSQGIQVFAGFISSSKTGQSTTLGRGGSDYTAAILAAALQADVLEIWTDVSGMLTADPRKVKKAFPIAHISYQEALELSYFGAKVLYPPSIQPVYQKNIPILIKNTFEPEAEGTLISTDAKLAERPIRGLSSIKNIALLNLSGNGMVGITGISMRLFGALGRSKVNVILISQASSEHSISIAIDTKDVEVAVEFIEAEFDREIERNLINKIEVENDVCIIATVGQNMKNTPGISGRIFSVIGKNGINVLAIAQGASELNISFVIKLSDEQKALRVIHEAFFSDAKVLNVFLVGIGLIGKTLLQQMKQQAAWLKEHLAIDIKLRALSNSRKMLLISDDENEIGLENWEGELAKSSQKADMKLFFEQMKALNLRNSVFVDCTANQEISEYYEQVLDSSISIITPNKLACTGKIETYKSLKKIAKKRNVKFLFETNVGAGLPILSTLNDLLRSGDEVVKIEAILSGTLNYIFNNVSKTNPISEVIKTAQAQGLTEPDPRIDMSGKDVARKILILAREIGMGLDLDDVEVENILPPNCFEGTIDDFWKNVALFDEEFEQKRSLLDAENQKFRVIASLENKKLSVRLRAVDTKNAFHNAEGSDSIVLFTTRRYFEQSLMVKGAGAGAEVTAAGVFADLIRVVN
jgi:aspartokinase/homoserine dehydrogenase 1